MQAAAARRRYWRATLAVAAALLGAWALVSLAPLWWARELDRFRILGWPLGFFLGAQAAIVACVVIVWVHGRVMDRLEREFATAQPEEAPHDGR